MKKAMATVLVMTTLFLIVACSSNNQTHTLNNNNDTATTSEPPISTKLPESTIEPFTTTEPSETMQPNYVDALSQEDLEAAKQAALDFYDSFPIQMTGDLTVIQYKDPVFSYWDYDAFVTRNNGYSPDRIVLFAQKELSGSQRMCVVVRENLESDWYVLTEGY